MKVYDRKMTNIIELKDLRKSYSMGRQKIEVLKGVNLVLPENRNLVILGPSGSGKSTLLNILSLLDKPDSGEFRLMEVDMIAAPASARQKFRERKTGFVFQSFHLIPELTVLKNVALPGTLAGMSNASKRAKEICARVGLGDRLQHRPSQLSGGERQRVAVARALFHKPTLIFADEPTGNLDPVTGQSVMTLIRETVEENKSHLILVTHNEKLIHEDDVVLRLEDGRCVIDQNEEVLSEAP
jgi:ABC-type lipoprotein export system ATPase subunit